MVKLILKADPVNWTYGTTAFWRNLKVGRIVKVARIRSTYTLAQTGKPYQITKREGTTFILERVSNEVAALIDSQQDDFNWSINVKVNPYKLKTELSKTEPTLRVCFRLQNGLPAKTYLFKDGNLPQPIATEIREHGWPGHGERVDEWTVVEVKVANEKIYLVYCVCIPPKRSAEALQEHPERLDEADFVAYKNTVYHWHERSARLTLKAIKEKVSPSVYALVKLG